MEYESLTRTTPPTVEPVTLAEAKAHLRVDSEADDAYILGLIATAREWVESYLDRTLIHTQWTMRMEDFPGDDEGIDLPRPPMATADANTAVIVSYTLSDGSTATLDSNAYRVFRNSTPGEVHPIYGGGWPSDRRSDEDAVAVTWWAGYGAGPADVPASIRHSMLMLIGHWYEMRSSVLTGTISKEIEFGVKTLLDSQRHFR